MTEQQKLLRVFHLIRLLKQRPGKTVEQLARSLDCHTRTVYRYLHLLEEVGYQIDKTEDPVCYFLFEDETRRKPVFTEDESELLRRALAGLPSNHALLPCIRQKLFMASTLQPLADGLENLHLSRILDKLSSAIENKCQVILVRYHSPNSNTSSDRLVEPLSLTDDYQMLLAYDPSDGREKTFKIHRIEDVEVLETPRSYRGRGSHTDFFGWTGGEQIQVTLALSKRAYHLLIEEFPLTRTRTGRREEDAFPYSFQGNVTGFQGLGRFILGLPGEVKVIAPDGLKEYLKKRVGEFLLE